MKRIGLGLCLALAVCTESILLAAPSNIVSEQIRSATPREIQVVIAQAEIKSDINPSNIATYTGGGLIWAMVDAARNEAKAKKAEAAIEPVRLSLADFDVDGLALDTTKLALAGIDWLQGAPISSGKDSSLLGKSALVDKSSSMQVAFIEYSYDLSPDFSSIRVVAKLQFANRTPLSPKAKPESRVQPKNLAYAQQVTAIVSLRATGKEMADNATTWSADNGKAAKAALKLAFAQIQNLLPRSLALTSVDIKAMSGKDRPRGVAGGFNGRIQESQPNRTLLWSGGFIDAITLPEAIS